MFPSTAGDLSASDGLATRLAELSEDFLAEYREGRCLSVAEFASRFPDLRKKIETTFPPLLALEEFKHDRLMRTQSALAESIPPLSKLGDFSIEREIGRGGMGIVYEARQLSLGRRVAVKILPWQQATPRDVERFHQEARIAARLHQSNIVPVYGSGTDGECHYFAMQRIDGFGLNEVLVDPSRPGPEISDSDDRFSRWVASVGIQAGEALAYSHQANYLHQDVKPANLLQDSSDRIWLTDFGLASLKTTAKHCRGGTARYRAPERERGHCDARSDVFSLGVTLHDLLAARFLKADQGVLRSHRFSNVLEQPSHARQVRSLPRDLRAIIHKATQTEPSQRYQTAAQFVADLQRFLNDRVVAARRVGAAVHLSRWMRRNRLLTVSLVVLTAVLGSSVTYFVHTNIKTTQLNRQLASLNQELTANNARLANAFFAVSALLRTSVVAALPEDPVSGTENLVPDSDEASVIGVEYNTAQFGFPLKRLLPEHPTTIADLGDDPELILSAFRAPRRVAETMHSFGRLAEAEAAYAYAFDLVGLAEELPDPPWELIAFRQARILNDLGQVAADRGDFLAAERLHSRALSTLKQYPGPYKNGLGDHERARAILGQEFALAEETEALNFVQRAWDPAAVEDRSAATNDESIASLRKVVAMCEATLEQRESYHASVLLGLCRLKLDRLTIADRQERTTAFETHLALIQSIAERPSPEPRYRHSYAEALASTDLIPESVDSDEFEWVQRNLNSSLKIATELSQSYPSCPGYRFTAADVSHKLAILARRNGSAESAEPYFRRALDRQHELVTRYPRSPRYRLWRSVLQASYARHLASQERFSEAMSALQVARDELEPIPEDALHPQILEIARQFVANGEQWISTVSHNP